MLKGVQTAEDAVQAAKSGVRGIVLSNHGGRQMDYCRSSIEILEEVTDALRAASVDMSKFEVFIDGGLRRGADIFKALALGAKAVGIGKPAIYALCAFGKEGVSRLVDQLHLEFATTMRLMGTNTIADIKREMVITKNLAEHIDPAPRVMTMDGNYVPMPSALSKL